MPLANTAQSRLERIYLQQEAEFGQIPQVGGAATLSGADACRHIHCSLQPTVKTVQRPDKTGTRTTASAEPGRLGAKWQLEMSLAANGISGQKPDSDPLLTAIMGQNGLVVSGSATITATTNTSPITVTAANDFSEYDVVTITDVSGPAGAGVNGTWAVVDVSAAGFTLLGSESSGGYTAGGTATRQGVKYTLNDSIQSFSLWRFRQPSSLQQMVGLGCVVSHSRFVLGQEVARWQSQGEAKWVLDSNEAPFADSDQLGGLTTFPTEPTNPVTNGGMISGFQGRAVIDGTTIATLRSATIDVAPNAVVPQDLYGTDYGQEPEAGFRTVAITFDMKDDDGAAMQNLYHKALQKIPLDLAFQVGRIPGSIFYFVLKGVQLEVPELEDGERVFSRKFSASLAHGSGAGSLDEITIWVV